MHIFPSAYHIYTNQSKAEILFSSKCSELCKTLNLNDIPGDNINHGSESCNLKTMGKKLRWQFTTQHPM